MMIPQRRNLVALLVLLLLSLYFNWRVTHRKQPSRPRPAQQHHAIGIVDPFNMPQLQEGESHPIEDLVRQADVQAFPENKKHVENLHQAALNYRKRRGRHPPPRFDEWYQFAQKYNALSAEWMFDQIYEDLEPFWSVSPGVLRLQVGMWPHRLNIRNGTTTKSSLNSSALFLDDWAAMVGELKGNLPDMDLAINTQAEPTIFAPWDTINAAIEAAHFSRNMQHPTDVTRFTSEYAHFGEPTPTTFDAERVGLRNLTSPNQLWYFIRETCAHTADARIVSMPESFDRPPPFPPTKPLSFVTNWTLAKSLCDNPEIRLIHGGLIAPGANAVITQLFPLFSGSKLQGVNNDILLPPASAWSDSNHRSTPWHQKLDMAFWRGTASGGQHTAETWQPFHRQRLVAMMNATQIMLRDRLDSQQTLNHPTNEDSSSQVDPTHVLRTYPMPPANFAPGVHAASRANNAEDPDSRRGDRDPEILNNWMRSTMDAAFVHLNCAPERLAGEPAECEYLSPFFEVKPRMQLEEQLERYKYLVDVDGPGASSRWHAQLASGSVPIKATVFREWHDSRLLAWRHFVPMTNTFADLWGIMEYFVGTEKVAGRDGKTPETAKPAKEKVGLMGAGQEYLDKTREDTIGAEKEHEAQQSGPARGKNDAVTPLQRRAESSSRADLLDLKNEKPSNTTSSTADREEDDAGDTLKDSDEVVFNPWHRPGHDELARRIAEQGSTWAARVLRREDMLVYVYRLLLEYARVINDERHWLAYVEDIGTHG